MRPRRDIWFSVRDEIETETFPRFHELATRPRHLETTSRDRDYIPANDPTDSVKALKEVAVLRIGFNPTRSTLPCYKPTHACNTYTKMNLSTVKWVQWDKTQSRELLDLFICVCIGLCTIVAHNIAQNRPDNFPSYSLDNHHCSNDVYLREGGIGVSTVIVGSRVISTLVIPILLPCNLPLPHPHFHISVFYP